VLSQTDTTDDPPILAPMADQYTAENKSITFKLSSIDTDGGDVEYGYQLVDTVDGSASVNGDELTFTPKKNYLGPVDIVVGVKTKDATTRGSLSQANGDIIYDTQDIQIAVGDKPASGKMLPLNEWTGTALTNIQLATFTDSDSTGMAANWSVNVNKDSSGNSIGGINWGDDTITSGKIVANKNGTFSVLGSHTYAAAGDYPISITIEGDKGTRILLSGAVHVIDMATFSGGVLSVNGTPGNDAIGISTADNQMHVNVNGTIEKFDALAVQRCNIEAGDGNDTVTLGAGVPGSYIDGGAGNDQLAGGDGNDTLTGGAGQNTLAGANGNDRLNGSGGHDVIYGGNGNDTLYGNGGDDTLDGGNGVDHIYGGDGNDVITGDAGNDKLYGQGGNDKFNGGAGADLEDGGDGIDTAVGDALDTNENIEAIL
jgi:Ca2+-binding RTX toxin-like protein